MRRRRNQRWVAALLLASVAVVASATGARAATGSARAYEMVSPVDKGDTDVSDGSVNTLMAQAAPAGNGIAYGAAGAFAGSPTNFIGSYYLGSRSASPLAWTTTPLAPPVSATWGQRFNVVFGNSQDLNKSVVGSQLALAPGAVSGNGNVYLRDNRTGAYTLIATSSDDGFRGSVDGAGFPPFTAGTPDFGHIIFSTSAALTPDAVAGVENVYEWTGNALRLVNYLPNGRVGTSGATPGAGLGGVHRPRIISEDGSRIFFSDTSDGAIYMREHGNTTVPISVSHRSGDPATPQQAIFRAASADGTKVFFISFLRLTDDATTNFGNDLYRYDVEHDELTDLSVDTNPADVQGAAVGEVYGTSDDARTVYFTALGSLAGRAVSGQRNIYVSRDGITRWVATLDPAFDGPEDQRPSVSANGRFLAFRAFTPLTGYDNVSVACDPSVPPTGTPGPCAEVYVYDAARDELRCVSCDPHGRRASGHAAVGGNLAASPSISAYFARAALDDRVFFDSPDALVPEDTNRRFDVYEYRDGEVHLISTGRGDADARMLDASSDGKDVFFATRQQLVTQDVDHYADVYDARVGGGIASQNPPPPTVPCSGSDCRGSTQPAPVMPVAASIDFAGHGNLAQPPRRGTAARVRVTTTAIQKGTIVLRVSVPAKGQITVRGQLVNAFRRSVTRAGVYTVHVRLTARARRALTRHRRINARMRITFAPSAGVRSSLTVMAAVKAARR